MICTCGCHLNSLVRKLLHARRFFDHCTLFAKTKLTMFIISPSEDEPSCGRCQDVMSSSGYVLDLLFVLGVFPDYVDDVRNFDCLPLLHFLNDLGSFGRNQLVCVRIPLL